MDSTLARTRAQTQRVCRSVSPSRTRSRSCSRPRSGSRPRPLEGSHISLPSRISDSSSSQLNCTDTTSPLSSVPASPTRSHTPCSSASTNSDDEYQNTRTPVVVMAKTGLASYTAEVTQISVSHAPIIGRGSIGPRQLDAFEYSAKRFFSHKSIKEEERVEKVMYNIDSSDVRAWVRENEEELKALTFSMFMARLRSLVLATDWAWEVAPELTLKQREDENFREWANNLREANDTLSTYPRFYIVPAKLRDHLLLHCQDDLRREYTLWNKDDCLDDIKDFHVWLRAVSDLDTVLKARKDQLSKHLANSIAQSTKNHFKNVTNTPKTSDTNYPAPGRSDGNAKGSTNTPGQTSARVYVYALTSDERAILDQHSGCYRCRRLYVGHRARECPEGEKPLTLAEYETRKLTPAFAADAEAKYLRSKGKEGGVGGKGGGTVTVVAIFDKSSDEDNSSDAGSEYVLPSHMSYSCFISAPSISPTLVSDALIDTGAPPAMISSTLVDRLGLPTRRLQRPLKVSGVFSKNEKQDTKLLSTYVKLVIISLCAQWHSCSQIFIV